jgi:hypothetical protein
MTTITFALTVMNETTTLLETVEIIANDFRDLDYEIVFITSRKANQQSIRIMNEMLVNNSRTKIFFQSKDGGAGLAIIEFRKKVESDFIFMLAADGETPAENCRDMYNYYMEVKSDILQASRWLQPKGMKLYPPTKRALNLIFQTFLKIIYRKNIKDWTYGMRIYTKKSYKIGDWNESGHAIYLESLIDPMLRNCSIVEYPVTWVKRSNGDSNILRIQLVRYLFVALKYRWTSKWF